MLGLKNKIVWSVVLLLIVGSWGGNIWYFQSVQLKEALFLKHDSTINGNTGEMLDFIFFENKQADNKVTGIQIEELPALRFQIYEDNRYTHQAKMNASAEFKPDLINEDKKMPFTISEIMVFYEKGQSKKVPIGEINVVWRNQESILNFVTGMSSSAGTGSYTVKIEEAAVLEKIEYTFSDKVKPWFELELSGKAVESLALPMKLPEGSSLALSYKWSIPDHEPEALNLYKSKIILHFLLKDGRTIIEDIPINHNLYISERQLKSLVRSGGDIH